MSQFETINPATEEVLAQYTFLKPKAIDALLEKASLAQKSWAKESIRTRVDKLATLKRILSQRNEELAQLMTQELGKPITQSRGEISKCGLLCDYYAKNAEAFLTPDTIPTEYQLSMRTFAPLGLILGIMPWNYPFWQVFRYVIPNLMVGNGVVLKHAPNVTACALAMADLFKEAGFIPDLFLTLVIDVPDIAQVIHHPSIRGITITGSERAGQSVAIEAGRALKKVVLELGGSDPYLILEDADLDVAAEACVHSRLSNAGQVCIAAKRILVHKSIESAFTERVMNLARTYICGDPRGEQTTMGPMARADLRTMIHEQVQRSIKSGGVCLMGAKIPEGRGYYYPATVLNEVSSDSPAFKEELFGPIICITRIHSESEAITLANQTPFGLGAAVFSKDIKRAQVIAQQLDVGSCAINTYVASHPALPFGGTKLSGFGRELSMEGMREFANIKTIMVR